MLYRSKPQEQEDEMGRRSRQGGYEATKPVDEMRPPPAGPPPGAPTRTPHDHQTYVPGCFRCELSRDEADRAADRDCD